MNPLDVMKKLFMIQKIRFRLLKNKFDHLSVHPGQVPILMLLWKNSGMTQRQIAEKLDVRPATIAVMLRRMEKTDLIYRTQDKNDRRSQRVFLTQRGKSIIDEIQKALEVVDEKAIEGFSSNELEVFNQFLDRILNNLKKQSGGWCHDKGSCVC